MSQYVYHRVHCDVTVPWLLTAVQGSLWPVSHSPRLALVRQPVYPARPERFEPPSIRFEACPSPVVAPFAPPYSAWVRGLPDVAERDASGLATTRGRTVSALYSSSL